MKRALRIGVLAAVIGTIALTIGLLMPRPQGAARSVQPGVTLLVNRQPRLRMAPGTPLLFDLSVSSSPAFPDSSVGSRIKPWHDLLRLEPVGATTATPWQFARIGTPRSMHVAAAVTGRTGITQDLSPVAGLDGGRHVHTVTFAVGPEQTATIAPGTYRFRGVLQTPVWLVWGGWTGRVVSGVATVVVEGERRPELHTLRLASTADFYLSAGRFEEAHRAAAALIATSPTDSRAHALLGDALAALGRPREALRAYQHAIAVLPRSYEPPTVLVERIRRVAADQQGVNATDAPPRTKAADK